MLGDAAQYISYAVSNTCPLPTPKFGIENIMNQWIN